MSWQISRSAGFRPALNAKTAFLQDCKGKSIVDSYYATCENLERATTGSWIGIQITYNTETEGSCAYTVMTAVTSTLDSGTKPWTRCRIATTISVNAVSVRSTMLAIQKCKGLLQLRYPQVECGNRMTDYRPAPEDNKPRMGSAESSITQQASQIALKVNTSAYTAEKVYRGTTTPASPTADMFWLDTLL